MTLAAEYQNIPDIQKQLHQRAKAARMRTMGRARVNNLATDYKRLLPPRKRKRPIQKLQEIKLEAPVKDQEKFRKSWERMIKYAIAVEIGIEGIVVLESPQPTFKKIVAEVSAKHDVPVVDIKSVRRNKKIVLARCEVSYRCKKETSMSFPQIGRYMGGRDHTTILYQAQKWERLIEVKNGRGKPKVTERNIDWSLIE